MATNPIVTLCVDACRGRVTNYAADKAKYTDEAVRNAFYEILGEDKLTYQNWRRHKIEIFEIIEEVLNTNLPDAWDSSPFYNEMVEVKNFLLGQKNEFIVEDHSTLIVSKFSGNHWNTDRQKLIGNKSFSLDTEWFYIRVYDELERFLKGINTVEGMFAKLQEGLQKDIDSRVSSAFTGANIYLPGTFLETGSLTTDNMFRLVSRVETESGKTARIAGTKMGLAKLNSLVDSSWVSDDMKNERNTTGRVRIWEGVQTVEIPQCFKQGTYDFRVPDTTLFVLPADTKPIKLFFEGDTRSRELGSSDTQDQTIDYQIQTKLGVGVIFNDLFGEYQITT